MSQGLVLFEKNQSELENIISACSIDKLVDMSQIGRTIALATGISQLRRILTDEIVRDVFMPLQSSRIGFCTDKDSPPWDATEDVKKNWVKGYPLGIVRDVTIEAFMHGLHMTGNEINIIAKNMYMAKAGVIRKVREWPGIRSLVVTPGAIQMAQDNQSARITMVAQWMIGSTAHELRRDVVRSADGKSLEFDSRFQIRVNKQMGSDAIIGKATRKMYSAILDHLYGGVTDVPIGDIMDTDGIVVEPTRELVPAEQEGKRIASTSLAMQGNDRS